MSAEEETVGSRYVEAAGSVYQGRYAIRAEELSWLLDATRQFNSHRLKLLTSLQRALPAAKGDAGDGDAPGDPVGDLKGLLTNVIIMQTRLDERDAGLVDLLTKATEGGLLESTAVDAEDVRQLADSVVQAFEHLEKRA